MAYKSWEDMVSDSVVEDAKSKIKKRQENAINSLMAQSNNYTPSAQQTLMNTPPAPTAPVPNKNTAPVLGAEYSEEDALRLNVANNRIIGQAIDRQYEKLDDYNFGEKALNDALSITQQNSQNVWDEDLLRLQRLQNNRNDLLSYMTPVQQMQYSRVPDNKKKDYLDTIMAELQAKKGAARANEIRNMEDSTNRDLQKIALSVESGGEGFKTGLKGAYNLLRGADETVAKGASEYAFEELRPETTGALGVAMDLGNTVGNMAPSIALGLVGGPLGVGALGTAAMGVSSAGKGYDSAIGEGYTPEQAATYGVASGVSEALLQRFAGALPGVSNAKGFVTRVLGKYGDDVLLKVAKNPSLAKGLITVLGNAASEGSEEGAQEIIDTFIRNAVLGEDKDINWKDVGYSALLGAVTGGMFAVPSGVNAYRDMQDRIKIGNEIKKDFEAFSKQLGADARRSAFEAGLNTPRLTGPTNTFYGTSDGTVVGGRPYTVEDVENVLAQYEEMKKVNKQAADAWLEAELQKYAITTPLLGRPTDFYAGSKGTTTDLPARYKSPAESVVEARNTYFANSNNPLLRRHFYSILNPRQALVDSPTMPESQRTLMGLGEEATAKTETPATNEPVEPENNAISAEDEAAFMQSDSFKEWHQAFLESDRTPESAARLEKDYRERLENFVRGRKTSTSVQETLMEQKTEAPTKKNENPASTNFSQNTVDSVQNNAADPQNEADNVSVEESAEQNMDNAVNVETDNGKLNFMNLQFAKDTNSIMSMLRKAYKGLVSGQAPLERMQAAIDKNIKGGATYDNPDIDAYTQLQRQAGGTVDAILENGLYDPTGAKIGNRSFSSIVKEIPPDDLSAFNDYMQNKHNISRMTLEERFENSKNKPVNGLSVEESRTKVAEYEKNHPEFVKYASDLRQFWNAFTKAWLVDSGMITQQQLDRMNEMYPDYIPTFRADKTNASPGGVFGKNIKTPNVVGKAKGGTSGIVPLQQSFAIQIDRIVRAVRKNDLGNALATFAGIEPELAASLGVAEADTPIESIDVTRAIFDEEVADNLKQVENGDYTLTYYRNGEANTLNISEDVFGALRLLQNSSGLEDGTLKMAVDSIRQATSPMKSLITGSNPVFALANVTRDFFTYMVNGMGNPVAMTSNWFKALHDSIKGSETLNQYRAMGGSQSGYFNATEGMSKNIANPKTGNKIKDVAGKIKRAPNAFNETLEMTTRYAEYLNNIKKYGNTPEGRRKAALAAADVTVNFSRSGPVTKNLDAATMYLNAGVQGLDNVYRHVKNNPLQTLAKGTIALTIPQLILSFINKDNPYYDELNDRTKDTYFVLPNFFDTDEKGVPKTFIKLPKTQQYGVWFSTFFDRVFTAMEKDIPLEEAFKGFGETVATNFTPSSPITGNIFSPISQNLPSNKDFANRNIVSSSFIYKNTPPEYQYDAKTSNFARGVAAVGKHLPDVGPLKYLDSPQQVDYLLDSYTGIAGDVLQNATAPKNKGSNVFETAQNVLLNSIKGPFESRFSANPVYSSKYVDELYDATDKAASELAALEYAGKNPKASPYYSASKIYEDAADAIGDLRDVEQEILSSPGSYADKKKRLEENRREMSRIAQDAVKRATEGAAKIEDDINWMTSTPQFNKMNEKQQDSVLSLYANYDVESSSDNNKIITEYMDYGLNQAEAVMLKQGIANINSNKNLESPEKRDEAIKLIESMGLDNESEDKLILKQGTEVCQETYPYVKTTFTEAEWIRIYDAVSKGNEKVKLGNLQTLGYSYSQSKQILSIYKSAVDERSKNKK